MPDWIIEIVSPGSKRIDYMTKLFKYWTSGVKEYRIADKEKNRVLVYYFSADYMEDYTFLDKVKVNIYDGLEIDFSQLEF